MQLKPEQVESQANKKLAPVYFISGDEPLRVMEAADAVRAAAREQGYLEREVLTVQKGFDWDSLASEAGNLSLFSQQRVIDLRLPGGKPGVEGSKALCAWAEHPPEDTLLLITAGKLEPAARKSKWVQALDKAGVVVFVWPLTGQEFRDWVQARMRQRGLEPTPEAITLLADRVEGNLLACMQEIDKLYLLQDGGSVDAAAILSMVADNARFDVYALVDSALSGDAGRSVRIMNGLQAEGVAPPVVLWALAREIRQLAAMAAAVAGGQGIPQVLAQYHVWTNRKAIVGAALKRLQPGKCNAMLQQCAYLDRVCKGRAAGNTWDELLQLSLKLAGNHAMPDATRMEQVS
ncbi:MAG: DNA polymerase III subunit delta [Gammaproteobacteria bacterium]|nr:DNA polymerase III subunit delta [Gammaproteobacteria bacterium]